MTGRMLPQRTRLIGILNMTQDSFSDGGLYLEPERACAHAEKLIADGADLVELGPASSHPDAQSVRASLEIERLETVVDALRKRDIPLAVDSFQMETQRWCLTRGIEVINDIQGFRDRELWSELAAVSCDLVVMHSVQDSGPATRATNLGGASPSEVVERISEFLENRLADLCAAGIDRERIIVDPGLGFFLSPSPEPSLAALRGIAALRRRLECRVLISVSRKSFLGALCVDDGEGPPRAVEDRLAATLAAELFAVRQGADFIRTHAVRELRDAIRVSLALEGESFYAESDS